MVPDALKTILIVEDVELNRDLLIQLLEDRYRVVVAADGEDAIERASDESPDLILMDLSLPGMDGWELTRRLKKNIATCHIPIIALTAYGKQGDAERAHEAGFAEFVAKPVSTRELPAIIRKHVRR